MWTIARCLLGALLLAPAARAGEGLRLVTQDAAIGVLPVSVGEDMVVTFEDCATAWEVSTGRFLGISETCGVREDEFDLAPWLTAPQREVAFAYARDGLIEVELGTLQTGRRFALEGPQACQQRPRAALSPSARFLVAGDACGELRVWDLDTGEVQASWSGLDEIHRLEVFEDGAGAPVVLIGDWGGELRVARPRRAQLTRISSILELPGVGELRGLGPLDLYDARCEQESAASPDEELDCLRWGPSYGARRVIRESDESLVIVAPLQAELPLRRLALVPESDFGLAGELLWWTRPDEGRTHLLPIDLSAPEDAFEGVAVSAVALDGGTIVQLEGGELLLLRPGTSGPEPLTGDGLALLGQELGSVVQLGERAFVSAYRRAALVDVARAEVRTFALPASTSWALEWRGEALVFPDRPAPDSDGVLTWPLRGTPVYAAPAEEVAREGIRLDRGASEGATLGVTTEGWAVSWSVDSDAHPGPRAEICLRREGGGAPEERCVGVASPVRHHEMGDFTEGVVDPAGRFALLRVHAGSWLHLDLEAGQRSLMGASGCESQGQTLRINQSFDRVLVASGRCAAVLDLTTRGALTTLALPAEAFDIESWAFSPDGRWVAGAKGQRAYVFDAESGALVATLFVQDPDHWAVIDPEGRLDRSSPELEGLHFVLEVEGHLESIGLAQLDAYYYEPRLLEKVLFAPEQLRAVVGVDASMLPPAVRWSREGQTLRVSVRDRGGGVGRVALWINGAEVDPDVRPPGWTVGDLQLDLGRYQRFFLEGGGDALHLVAWDAGQQVRSRGGSSRIPDGLLSDPETDPVDLYAVVIGTHEYGSESLALSYPTQDAHAIAAALQRGGEAFLGPSGGQVHVSLLSTADGDARPSAANLEAAFAPIREAKPHDILIVYLSGHGLTLGGQYYYPWPEASAADLGVPAVLAARSLTQQQLMGYLRESPIRNRLLVLDTCEAGGVAEGARSQLIADAQKRAVEELRQGMALDVLVGAPAGRSAYEHAALGHGLLTYALLEGLLGEALQDGQYWDVATLAGHAVERVPEIALELGQSDVQRPLMYSPEASRSFRFGVLPAEREGLPQLTSLGLPVVSGAHLVHLSEHTDVQRLSAAVARSMAAQSSAPWTGFRWSDAETADSWSLGGVYEERGEGLRVELTLKAPEGEKWRLSLTGDAEAIPDCVAIWTSRVIHFSEGVGGSKPPKRLSARRCADL